MTRRKPVLLVYYKKWFLYVAEATNFIHKLYTAYTRKILSYTQNYPHEVIKLRQK